MKKRLLIVRFNSFAFYLTKIETSTQLSFAFWVGAWTIFDKTDAEYKKKERKKHQKCQSDLDLSPNE